MEGFFRRAGREPLASKLATEPVLSALNSSALLHANELHDTLSPWVGRASAELIPAQLALNQVLFDELGPALLPAQPRPDFPSYLEALAAEHPERLRERVLQARAGADAPSLSAAAATLLDAPFQLHDTAVGHLRGLWERHLEREWSQWEWQRGKLGELLRLARTGPGATQDALQRNLQLLVRDRLPLDPAVRELVFVPSPHVGRHVTELRIGQSLYLFFDAELHGRTLLRDAPIRQPELLGRLRGLADPARLRVLELLAQYDELALQDLMALLDTSQPNVSRYLNALGPFVVEQRGKDGRKRYRLVPSQLDLTFESLKNHISASSAAAERAGETAMEQSDIQRFLDPHGHVRFWPRSHESRIAVLSYLADKFTPDQNYTEKEVSAVLQQYVQPALRDHVTVRRDLLDYRLMQRSSDGARYWRSTDAQPQAPRQLSDEEAYARYWGAEEE